MIASRGSWYPRPNITSEMVEKDNAWKECSKESIDKANAMRQYVNLLEDLIKIDDWHDIVSDYYSGSK